MTPWHGAIAFFSELVQPEIYNVGIAIYADADIRRFLVEQHSIMPKEWRNINLVGRNLIDDLLENA